MNIAERLSAARLHGLVRLGSDLLRRKDEQAVARRASALALVIRLANAALAYVAQVVLARLMGQFEYGVFAYCWVWFMVGGAVSTLGFGDAPLRFIPQLRERGEADHLRGFLRFAALVTIATSFVAAALLIAGMLAARPWIGSAYVLPMVLMALSLPFAGMQSFLEGVGRTYGWTLPALLPIYILRHGLLLAFMLGAVALGFEPSAIDAFICLVLTLALSLIYQAGTMLLRLRRVVPAGPAAYRPREWLRGAAPFAVLHGANYLSSFTDVLVLSFFVSPAELAIYFAATRIIQVVNLVPFAATVGTAHVFSATHTRGDRAELTRLGRHVAVTTFIIAAVAVGILLVAGEWLLGMFGEGFTAGYVPLSILALGVLTRVAAGPAEDMLNMTGHGGLSASTYLAAMLLSVALNVALVIPFGVDGAALATSTALMARALYLTFAVRRRLGINISVASAIPSWSAIRAGLPGRHREAEDTAK